MNRRASVLRSRRVRIAAAILGPTCAAAAIGVACGGSGSGAAPGAAGNDAEASPAPGMGSAGSTAKDATAGGGDSGAGSNEGGPTSGGPPGMGVDGGGGNDGSAAGSGFMVVTNRYDNARSGANLSETVLTTANVASSQFGLLFSRPVDGQIYAQPLFLSKVSMPGGAVQDVVYVATEHNTVFAFDATTPSAQAPLWKTTLEPPASATAGAIKCDNLAPEVGVSATPVIDAARGILFVLDKSYDGTHWNQYLHALDVATGADRPGSPIAIVGSVPGTASDATGGMVSFNPMMELARPGLLLAGDVVYMAFASHCDKQPYHGWIFGYSYGPNGFTQKAVTNLTPNGSEGGIWQGGVGLSSDGTSLYAAVGNGSTDPKATPPVLAEAVVKLALSDLHAEDYWIPSAYVPLNQADSDLSTGAVLLPHGMVITGSKAGQIYLLDQANLGKFNAGGDQILQTLTTPGKAAGQRGHVHGGPIDYTLPDGGEWVYLWAEDSQLTGYGVDPALRKLITNASGGPLAQGAFATQPPGHPGGVMTLSANGSTPGTAILWASTPKDTGDGAWHTTDPGVLYAVDAADVTHLLWSANPMTLAGGGTANVAKFNSPVVANGRVYVGTFSNALNVYGLK